MKEDTFAPIYTPPPGVLPPGVLDNVRWYENTNGEGDLYDWYFDPAFPVTLFEPESDYMDLWLLFHQENINRTDGWERTEFSRPDERYYDTYWGWWNNQRAYEGQDCPIVVIDDTECVTWDGFHRMLIARLAQIGSVPVIVGFLKEERR